MGSIMACLKCGKDFDTQLQEVAENGNPICPECKKKELEKDEANK